jgi:hypothetical protein
MKISVEMRDGDRPVPRVGHLQQDQAQTRARLHIMQRRRQHASLRLELQPHFLDLPRVLEGEFRDPAPGAICDPCVTPDERREGSFAR